MLMKSAFIGAGKDMQTFLTLAINVHGSLDDVTRFNRNSNDQQWQYCTCLANVHSNALPCQVRMTLFMQNVMLTSTAALQHCAVTE